MVSSSSNRGSSSSTGKGRSRSEERRAGGGPSSSSSTGKNKNRRGFGISTAPPSTASQPIPIANANSGSTGATTTNPSVNSGLSSSSTSSSGSNALATAAGQSEGGAKPKPGAKRRGLANLEDIPGSRVGPDDGPWPKEYDILETEEDLWKELRSLARPHRAVFVNYDRTHPSRSRSRDNRSRSNGRSAERMIGAGSGEGEEPMVPVLAPVGEDATEAPPPVPEPPSAIPRVMLVDSVNFQPCKTLKTQDRYVVTQLEVHGEMWTLTGVFDGHLGDVTVEHVSHHLPIIIREFLKSKLPADFTSADYDPEHISQLFQSAIAAFDDAIAHDILDLFGGSVDQLSNYSDDEIRRVINDNMHGQGMYGRGSTHGGENWRKARLCMYGTTALVTLMDPKGEGFWVANLGDCMGILVTRTVTLDENDEDELDGDAVGLPAKYDDPEVGEWTVEVLTTMHNGDNDKELDRIRSEHPGEEDTCIKDRRVLGALAPTRCLGDIPFKQPPEFTRRVLYNLFPFVHNTQPWEEFLQHNLTPPYISSQAEIVYRRIHGEGSDPLPPPLEGGSGKRRASGISAVIGRFNSIKRGRKAKKQVGIPRTKKQRFLILASDGFLDLCLSSGGVERVVKNWAKEMVGIGSPRKEVEETHEKLRERAANPASDHDEPMDAPKPITIPVPIPVPAKAPLDMSQVHFAFGDTESSIIAVSPVSATSPVPFTANSFSSSVGSLAIPSVPLHVSPSGAMDPTGRDVDSPSLSGMSTPAYAFSIPPTRAASPSSHFAVSASPSGAVGSPPKQGGLSPQLQPSTSPGQHSYQAHLAAPASSSATSSAPPPLPPSQPQVPKLNRPPLPHTNRSYHCTSSTNMALRLLRCALGGVDRDDERVAKALTVDMNTSWLDDTSIVVLGL